MSKLHDIIIHLLCLPLYAYHLLIYLWDQVAERKRKIGDATWLRRMHLSQEEFDKFMEWRQKNK